MPIEFEEFGMAHFFMLPDRKKKISSKKISFWSAEFARAIIYN